MYVVPARLVKPGRRHDRAHQVRVNQHNTGVAHADVLVARLHQLAAGGMARAGDMRALEFLPRANVAEGERAVGVFLPGSHFFWNTETHSKAPGHALVCRIGLLSSYCRT